MADRKRSTVPIISSSTVEKHAGANLIVLRPVDTSLDATDSSPRGRPKRTRREWPPRSPPPSPPKKGANSEVSNAIVKEESLGEGQEDVLVDGELRVEQRCIEAEGNNEESEETETGERKRKGVRSKGQLWQPLCSLPSEEMFQKWKQESEQTISPARWAKKRYNEGKSGTKRYYQCNVRGCQAELAALYPHHSETVEVLQNGKTHYHPRIPKKWGLSAETKKEVERLWESGLRKPRLIKASLDKVGLGDCRPSQLSNFLERLRRRSRPPVQTLSMNALDKWCAEHSISQPTAAFDGDIDRIYVFNHNVDAKMCQFRFVISSKRLMKFAARASTLSLDASHSMKWFGSLVLFVGVSDASGQFFPVLFAVMSQETKTNYLELFKVMKQCVEAASGSQFQPGCVIGHHNPSLAEAVQEVFPNAARRLCWLQVKRGVTALLKHVDKDLSDAFERDVGTLRLSCNKAQFELAAKLMLQKWRELLPTSDAPSSFEEQFVKSNAGWYEGFDVASHSSNRSLVLTVNAVKNRHTLRERLPMDRYLSLALELVLEWSVGVSETEELQASVQPDKTLLSDTCRLQSEQKTMVEVNSAIYVPTGDQAAATVDEVDVFEEKMQGQVKTFDEFVEARMSLWKVEDTGNKSDLSHMRCSCPRFCSGKLCEHVLAIGSAFGLFELPQSAWDSIQGSSELKRKRGRPPKRKADDVEQITVGCSDVEAYIEEQEFALE